MTFSTNCSGNRYIPILFLLPVLLAGCAAAPVAAPGRNDGPPSLEIRSPVPDRASPQAAGLAAVRWTATATGGAGPRTFTFLVSDGKEERSGGTAWAREGVAPSWEWRPMEAGMYRVKAVVEDASGKRAESEWSPPYEVVPPLTTAPPFPDKVSPQAATMATVRWRADASGCVGECIYRFGLSDGKGEKVVQEGGSASWEWSPEEQGKYRVKVVVRDAAGNEAESAWSPEYAIVPPLSVSSFSSDKVSPQVANTATVRWKIMATGGVGRYTYAFRSTDGKVVKEEQKGLLPTWDWSPREPGTYRVKAVVWDAIGNMAESDWSSEYVVSPSLMASLLAPPINSPQAAGMTTVYWKVDIAGGAGDRTIEFRLADGAEEKVAQLGPSAVWVWSPQTPGTYRVKAVVRDTTGTTLDTAWSPEYVVVPKLTLVSLAPDRTSPQAAGIATVRWKAEAAGGVGERNYRFWISGENGERAEQKGPSPTWDWSPVTPGLYRVKVEVSDAAGNTVGSGWTPEYRIDLTAGTQSLIAVMPMVNLTGRPLLAGEMRRSLIETMRGKGLNVLDEDAQEKFLERHRVRYTGGLSGELGEALREETGASVVLFVSLELFEEAAPPKVALIARLVSTHRKAAILWTDSVGIAGNDAPGLLLLGLVNDPRVLWDRAKEELLASLIGYLSSRQEQEARKVEKRFLPKSYHGVPPKAASVKESLLVAVLPFRNEATRRNAGEIMALHFVRGLANLGTVDVVEPGMVRQSLLRTRMIMEEGLSLPQADLLRAELNVALVLTGIVTEYQDSIGGATNPKVEFSARVFDMETRQIIWSSSSYNEGDDGVFFFNLGKVNTANRMAAEMVRSVVERMDAVMRGRNGQLAATVSPAPPHNFLDR